jgi:hypothetical protein
VLLKPVRFADVWTVGRETQQGVHSMKTFISTLALAVALAFTGPAFAGDVTTAKTQADCEKAGGMWDATNSKCSEKKM